MTLLFTGNFYDERQDTLCINNADILFYSLTAAASFNSSYFSHFKLLSLITKMIFIISPCHYHSFTLAEEPGGHVRIMVFAPQIPLNY